MNINAGNKELLYNAGSYTWCYLDIGFSNKLKTCGLLIANNEPIKFTYSEAINEFISFTQFKKNICFVIEAPLSVCFDKRDNPKGRKIEREGNKTRYWYNGLGCAVMVAAIYFLKTLFNYKSDANVYLFEGFVSFKNKKTHSNHCKDVLLLKQAVEGYVKNKEGFFFEDELLIDESDRIQSAGKVAGLDFGIPPLIKISS